MNDVLKQAAEALRQAQAFIDGMQSDLHRLRATDWFPEGAHDAASSMSENMRLLGNACADFDCIGAGLAALESAQERPLGAAIAPEHEEAMARMAADAERKHAELVRDAGLWRAAQARQGEALVRFCPGCGSIGEVESKYRDCCPDGSHARRIPESLATRCQSLFRAALESAVAPQPLRELSEDGWLPIEMAPKDSTRILVSWPMREMDEDGFPVGPITSRHTLLTGWNGGGWLEPNVLNASGSWFGDEDCFTAAPDLWQPLPNPPSAMRAARSAK